ncbi:MAG: hypothetical protein ACI395_06655 [Candidatus Cryptobacteroides sp.]
MEQFKKIFRMIGLVAGRMMSWLPLAFLLFPVSCEEIDDDPEKYGQDTVTVAPPLDDVALLLSEIRMENSHLKEVYTAVTSSSFNGYDEEYMMKDLFATPGAGVGDDRLPDASLERKSRLMSALPHLSRTRQSAFAESAQSSEDDGEAAPLRDLIAGRLEQRLATRADDGQILSAEEYMEALSASDIQIYWPYSDQWDGEEYPIMTFDPSDGGSANVGYRLVRPQDGDPFVEEVIVDEKTAMEHPVWVVNRNDDSGHLSLDMLRMREPEWGTGGEILVNPNKLTQSLPSAPESASQTGTKSESSIKTLVLRDFTMKRNYDSWFAGASEFFVKIGSIENFRAGTEAELRLYNPTITDFMIVVRRNQVGIPQPFNAVLVSEWTDQLTNCAFMIIEDDGGTRTSWNCSGVVKINSKSYGFEITIPINIRDDIVWRGQLSRTYIEANNARPAHYGDVDLTLELIDASAPTSNCQPS